MVVASPAGDPLSSLPGGVTTRVATKYPRLTRAFFAETGLGVEVITVAGSVEVAPLLGLSHWIVDLVETGRTLRENGLVERAEILRVGAVVVVNRASQKLSWRAPDLRKLSDATTDDARTYDGRRSVFYFLPAISTAAQRHRIEPTSATPVPRFQRRTMMGATSITGVPESRLRPSRTRPPDRSSRLG